MGSGNDGARVDDGTSAEVEVSAGPQGHLVGSFCGSCIGPSDHTPIAVIISSWCSWKYIKFNIGQIIANILWHHGSLNAVGANKKMTKETKLAVHNEVLKHNPDV